MPNKTSNTRPVEVTIKVSTIGSGTCYEQSYKIPSKPSGKK